jgi:hypothetical protein
MSRKIIFILALLVILIPFLLIIWGKTSSQLNLNSVNKNVDIEENKFGMMEENVIKEWGTGELISAGEGGYSREYKSKGIRIGFPLSDTDNDFYGKVGELYFTNPEFSAWGVNKECDKYING